MTPMLSAIVSILIGNFLIGLLFRPALERLQEIRATLLSVIIPIDDVRLRSFRGQPWNRGKLEKAEEEARLSINETLRQYQLAYSSFMRIALFFLIALLLLVNITIAATPLDIWFKLFLCLAASAIIFLSTRLMAPEAFPSPERLWNLDYLASHFPNFQPESFIRLLNIGVEKTRENPSRLCLSCGVHLTGYKYFLMMTNEDESKPYFISYGKITARTSVNQVILADHYRWLIPLGELDPEWPTGLEIPVSIHLFVFIPTPVGWTDAVSSPYFVSHELWAPFPGGSGEAGETLGITICSPKSKDRYVSFLRKRTKFYETWEIQSIDTEENKSHFRLRRLLWFYKHELENSTGIHTLVGVQLPSH